MDTLDRSTTDSTTNGLAQLERQLERGYRFSHTVIGESMLRTSELQVLLHGLLDTLLAKGVTSEDELVDAMQKVRNELAERDELNWQRAMIRNDAREENKTVSKVDCEARLPVCRAACCKLDFALSVPELEASEIKWDLGRPYFIRHDSNGYCSHLDAASGRCGIYDKRPCVCRNYSCAEDKRIWNDFDKMELNQEWVDANLTGVTEPVLVDVFMHDRCQLEEASDKNDNERDEVMS